MLDYVNILQTQSRFCHLSSLAWHLFCSLDKRLAYRLNGLWAIYKSLKVFFWVKLKLISFDHQFLLHQILENILRRNNRALDKDTFLFLSFVSRVSCGNKCSVQLYAYFIWIFQKKKKNHHFLKYYLFSLLISIYQLDWVSKFKFHWIIATEINH